LSSSASLTQVVNGIPTVTTVVSVTPSPLYALQPAAITAKVTGPGGIPTGTVTFTSGGAAIGAGTLSGSGAATLSYTFPASGNQAVIATYNPNGDPNYAPSTSAPYAVNVLINDSETSLVVTPSPVLVYHTVTLTATVTSVSASAFGVTAYGTVNFLDGSTLLGSATLNASGVATLTYTFTQNGNQNLVASYAGNVAFAPSQSSSQLIVVKPSPTASTVTSSSNPQGLGLPVTFTATVTAPGTTAVPVGTVTFFDGTNPLGAATVSAAGTATFTTSTLALGAHSITVSFTNTTIYFLPSVSPAYAETIIVFPTATTLTSSINPQEIGSPVTFTATVAVSPVPPSSTPGVPVGTVTFYDGTNSLGTVTLGSSGTASFTTSALPLGLNSITASYTPASPDYLPSVSPILIETIVVALGDFTITLAPTSQKLYTGEATQAITVTLVSSGGFDRPAPLRKPPSPTQTAYRSL
ncbi:MAG: Ig-like domain-containing protein, partial [Terracidiphilus sp.]